jgi:hypothetical protein
MNGDREQLENDFNIALLADYETAMRELNYSASIYYNMIQKQGGVQTVQKLLGKSGGTYGLEKLKTEGRLDLSMEAKMLDPRFRSLFTQEELATARRVLLDLGYDPEQH